MYFFVTDCVLFSDELTLATNFSGKSILQVPDTGTRVLDNTRPFLCSSIVSLWIILACSKERKDHIFGQYWHTKNVPVLTNTGTFQYLGPEVYFFHFSFIAFLLCMHVFVIMVISTWDQPMIFLLFCLSLVLYEIFAPNCILVVCRGLISSEISALNCVFDWVRISHF